MDIDKVLDGREPQNGSFAARAHTVRRLQVLIQGSTGWTSLSDAQQHALNVITDKVSRILHGDPDHEDHWLDIEGYARLARGWKPAADEPDATAYAVYPTAEPSRPFLCVTCNCWPCECRPTNSPMTLTDGHKRTHPCIGRCTTTTGDFQCKGCGRTLEEIRDWNSYTVEERQHIMNEVLPLRLKSPSKG